jgi:hypothetical protein
MGKGNCLFKVNGNISALRYNKNKQMAHGSNDSISCIDILLIIVVVFLAMPIVILFLLM